jgi:hypothetical protein
MRLLETEIMRLLQTGITAPDANRHHRALLHPDINAFFAPTMNLHSRLNDLPI